MHRFAALPALALLVLTAPVVARSQETSVRSTAQVEVALEPAKTARTVALELPAPGESTTHEAVQKRSEAVEHLFEGLGPGRLEIRVASRDGASWISIYRDDSEAPEGGTGWDKRAVMWTGAADAAGRLRVVTYVDAEETPYRLVVKRGAEDAAD